MLADRHGPHRSPRRFLQPGAPRAPAYQPCRHARARARRNMVARLSGQSAEGGRQGHGAIRGPFRLGRTARARGAPIRVSDFEMREGVRFTVDTVRALQRRHPEHDFIWLLGSDTLPNFHKWRDWRGLAREVPIAVIPRPGYDSAARAVRAMGWLRRFVRPSGQARRWTEWSAPAIIFLRLPPDPTSATAVRAADPSWYRRSPHAAYRGRHTAMPLFARRPLDRTSR